MKTTSTCERLKCELIEIEVWLIEDEVWTSRSAIGKGSSGMRCYFEERHKLEEVFRVLPLFKFILVKLT